MSEERVWPLDEETLALFASKAKQQGDPGAWQVGNANGVKVRRVMQVIRDLARRPVNELRLLDLACGEGVYAIEAALRGVQVTAIDGRTERMDQGRRAAERLGLTTLRFEQNDVRQVSVASHGEFDVVLFLGILYHLDVPDVFHVLQSISEMCRHLLIIDTRFCLHPDTEVQFEGLLYRGERVREHGDHDPESIRRSRLLASLDNTFSFIFGKHSLLRVLNEVGFTSVYECHVPLEPRKAGHRITVAAAKGPKVRISSYPWVNDKTEEEIAEALGAVSEDSASPGSNGSRLKRWGKAMVNRILRPLGLELRRTRRT
jgi:SAM-dependent methyltransferase